MYSVAPAAKSAWRKLLGWILERSALRMEIVDHDPPAALGICGSDRSRLRHDVRACPTRCAVPVRS
jgi:hypothetical protein